jgi:hypothetical protein
MPPSHIERGVPWVFVAMHVDVENNPASRTYWPRAHFGSCSPRCELMASKGYLRKRAESGGFLWIVRRE